MRDHKKPNIWLIVAGLVAVLALVLVLVLPGGDDSGGTEVPPLDDGPGASTNDPTKPGSEDTSDPQSGNTPDPQPDPSPGKEDPGKEDPGKEDPGKEDPGPSGQPSSPDVTPPDGGGTASKPLAEQGLRCGSFSRFSGRFVEDGKDELVKDVAAVLVTNTGQEYLDFATLVYTLDGKTCTFVVTGLPGGESAWVMETERTTATANSELVYQDCITSFRPDAVSQVDGLTVSGDGASLRLTNNTGQTLKNVYLYYKNRHSDGNFFGGITYRVNFAELADGQTGETMAGHYDPAVSEIVRVTWE